MLSESQAWSFPGPLSANQSLGDLDHHAVTEGRFCDTLAGAPIDDIPHHCVHTNHTELHLLGLPD